MAYITDNTHSVLATVSGVFNAIGGAITNFMLDVYNAGSRRALIEELQSMDDASLRAKHGIERSQIVSYVFRDKVMF